MHISMAVCTGSCTELGRHEREIATALQHGTFAPWLACAQALLGRRDDARRTLGPVVELPHGFPWLITAGQTVILLEDVDLARRFYTPLRAEGLMGRFFWGPAGAFPFGPTTRVLGELATMLGHADEARAFLDEAVAECTAAEATSLLRLSEAARARLGAPPAPAKTAPLTVSLAREGDVWVVTSRREAIRVKHAKGFEYLATLLESPGREHYVLALAGAGEGPEDAGTVLDERARASYRARVEDLEDQLAEAERQGDRGHAQKAREELEAIADQLAGAVGLGGRDRKAASNVERARINVQRRIKDAIRRVAEHDAELGRYLEATVRTGTYCSYRPI
jgi:hypothetical protein